MNRQPRASLDHALRIFRKVVRRERIERHHDGFGRIVIGAQDT
ncbi:Hypothetical protein CAP_7814 [Chondromyces apiculatus DSM 436]|uniref:Uncharacterized protein n=1 Tax=Chondromyces apiculatus DSM 436 TaxID=1192034 RepID=A0A017SXQ0_9BACT|nr:Hypothetical protein CAP_7814 [Chondromyces apiculatus DSM 436]